MQNRILTSFVCVLFMLVSTSAHAQQLTEAEVVRLARTRAAELRVLRAEVSAHEARETRPSLYPNPSLEWQREHVPTSAAAETEDLLFATIPLEFSGRRSAEHALARSETAAQRALSARGESGVIERALELFYAGILANREADRMRMATRRLDQAAEIMKRRVQEATSSGYERARLEIEAELLRSEFRELEARAVMLRTELALLIGAEPQNVILHGDLKPATAALEQIQASRPRRSVELSRTSVVEAKRAQDSAKSAWLPQIVLSGGVKRVATEDVHYGYVAGVALALPLFSRGQDARRETHAQAELAQARLQAAERSARAESIRAAEQLRLSQEELSRFESATRDRIELMLRATESGYREGERSLLELLDAHKAQMLIEKRQLELQFAAKRAELAVRAARGEFE